MFEIGESYIYKPIVSVRMEPKDGLYLYTFDDEISTTKLNHGDSFLYLHGCDYPNKHVILVDNKKLIMYALDVDFIGLEDELEEQT